MVKDVLLLSYLDKIGLSLTGEGNHYFCLDVSPGHGTDYVHYFYHLIVNVKAYLTLAPFTVVSAYF